jgi:hypothetical protein
MLEVFSCDQNTEIWHFNRLGIPTTSQFKTVKAEGKGGGESITRRKYLFQLAGEIITGKPVENYANAYMARGHEVEDELRNHYAFLADIEPKRVGFIRNGRKGSSPDSLIGKDGVLEIKSNAPHILIELILKDKFPPEHKAQTQGQLWVSERDYVDIICGYPGMPPLIKRAYRDSLYIKQLSDAIDQFNDELDAVVEMLKAYNPSVPALERAA